MSWKYVIENNSEQKHGEGLWIAPRPSVAPLSTASHAWRYMKEYKMLLCECPYCKKPAASFWWFGNTAYVFNKNKKCPNCLGRIRIGLASYFWISLIAFINVIIFLILNYNFRYEMKNLGLFILLFVGVYGLIYLQVVICSKYCNLRLFLPKDNVVEHMKNLPSYLKWKILI